MAISGFGNFEIRKRAAREGRNPRTGKAITIKASTVPAFRAGKALKDLVNRKRPSASPAGARRRARRPTGRGRRAVGPPGPPAP